MKTYMQKWYTKNKEHQKANSRRWQKSEKGKAYYKAYHKTDKYKAYQKAYKKAYQKAYRVKNWKAPIGHMKDEYRLSPTRYEAEMHKFVIGYNKEKKEAKE